MEVREEILGGGIVLLWSNLLYWLRLGRFRKDMSRIVCFGCGWLVSRQPEGSRVISVVCRPVGKIWLVVPYFLESLSQIQARDRPLGQPILEVVIERGILIDGVEEGTHEGGLLLVE
jgi:hypothetical protein